MEIPNLSLRDKAIEFARLRIQQDGFANLRLSDVARDLKVTHAALYKHFNDKQDLLDAVNVNWMDEINAQLAIVCHANDEVCSKIKQWFLQLYALRRDKVLRSASEYALYVNTEELQRPCAMKDALERRTQLATLVSEAMRTGKIQQASTEETVTLLFHLTDYFIHPAFVASHAEKDKTEEFSQALNVVLAGLKPDAVARS